MSNAPTAQEQFDEQASNILTAVYLTPDVVAQREKVLALLEPKHGERALDIGCGPGLTTEALALAVGASTEVIGIDIATPMLAIAKQRCDQYAAVKFEQADVMQLPFQGAQFDIALASQVYEYVEHVDHALRELARVVRPGGRVALVDTDWESAVWASHDDARMRRVLETWDQHIPHPRLPRSLKRRLQQAGFEQISVEIVPLLNLTYDPQTYSVGMMTLLGNFAAGRNGLTAEDIAAWQEDARAIGAEDDYFFSLNRYVFLATRS